MTELLFKFFEVCYDAGGRICPVNGKCYAFRFVSKNFQEAKMKCQEHGGSLMKGPITDPEIIKRCKHFFYDKHIN